MASLPVFNIQKYCIHDGDGIRTTVFFKGCPLRCAWCHNPESQKAEPQLLWDAEKCTQCGACAAVCPQGAAGESVRVNRERCRSCGVCVRACPAGARQLSGKGMSPEEIVETAKKDLMFYEQSGGGVTLSGGEVMAAEPFDEVVRLCRLLHEEGISVFVDTCGMTPYERFDAIRAYTDCFLYLILDCMDDMKLLQPSSNVQISRKTPQKFLLRACEISRKGWGQPAFYNTEAILQELMAAGKSIEDARRGGTSGCVETGAFGNEAYILTGYFNLPKILELTLYNGYDYVADRQLGLPLGSAEDFHSYEELLDAYHKQIDYFLDIKMKGSNIIESIYANYMPVPFLSIITNDCISKGKDYNAGGARYNTSYLQGVGIGTVTDCLAAIRYQVYQEKNIPMKELLRAMREDFANDPQILSLVQNFSPKYGNDDDFADSIMQDVFGYYQQAVTGRPNQRGGSYRINMLPTTCHVYFGEVMLASANGRRAHKPVSEGISPEKGADTHGPTAVLRSCAKMDHIRTGGTLLNQKFTPSVVAGETGLMQMANLIRTYFNMDGHHIQFNVIDRQTLLDAQAHPEEYKDLIVRVAGYSDHFSNLSKALQDEIIARTEQSFA